MHKGLVQSAKAPLQTAVVTLQKLFGQWWEFEFPPNIKGASCVVEIKYLFRPKPLAQNMNKPFRVPDCKSAKVLLVELLKLRWLLANDFFKIFT